MNRFHISVFILAFCLQLQATSAVAETTNIQEYKDGRQIEIQANPRGATIYVNPDYKPAMRIPPLAQNRPDSHEEFSVDGRYEPAWTLKIPKGRYPCFCDPPPATRESLPLDNIEPPQSMPPPPSSEPDQKFSDQIEKIINAKLKEQLVGVAFEDNKQLRFEVDYVVTKSNQFLFFREQKTTENRAFNAAVYQTVYRCCEHSTPTQKEFFGRRIQLRFVITPEGVLKSNSSKAN